MIYPIPIDLLQLIFKYIPRCSNTTIIRGNPSTYIKCSRFPTHVYTGGWNSHTFVMSISELLDLAEQEELNEYDVSELLCLKCADRIEAHMSLRSTT